MDKKEKKTEVKKELSKEEFLVSCRSTLTALKIKSKMGQLVKTHQLKNLKKEIARLLTVDNKKNK